MGKGRTTALRGNYEPRHRAVWMTAIPMACVCQWDRDEADMGFWMTRRNPHCVMHRGGE